MKYFGEKFDENQIPEVRERNAKDLEAFEAVLKDRLGLKNPCFLLSAGEVGDTKRLVCLSCSDEYLVNAWAGIFFGASKRVQMMMKIALLVGALEEGEDPKPAES